MESVKKAGLDNWRQTVQLWPLAMRQALWQAVRLFVMSFQIIFIRYV
jgi:hypothetical protein